MVDLTTLPEAAARDPLVGAFVLMATGVLVSRLPRDLTVPSEVEMRPRSLDMSLEQIVFMILIEGVLGDDDERPYRVLQHLRSHSSNGAGRG
jgi:hypothetical protein